MSFTNDIEYRARPIRQAIFAHPFISGIGDGTLPVDKFQHYVKQDYVYLIDYSRVLALASARAPDLESMGWFAGLLNEILNTEMELHRSYCAEFGITRDDLAATAPAPTTVGYTSFLLKVAHQGTFGEVVACLLPCLWGYWEIGDQLARLGEPEGAPLYSQWIQMYSSPEYSQLAQQMRDLANRVGQGASPAERVAMADVYLTSLRYEHQFWEMAYNLEEWPV